MRVVTLDFETYYNSKSYSLTKQGPISYIRDDRFTPLCVAVRVDHGPVYVMEAESGKIPDLLKALELDRSDTVTVGHNISGFDGLILSEFYHIHPAHIVDTIPMMHWCGLSRVIPCSHKALTAMLEHGIKQPGTVVSDGKRFKKDFTSDEWEFFKRYNADDVKQCSENFFSMLPYMTKDCLVFMDLTAKMATEPAFIPDGAMLRDYIKELNAKSEEARQALAHFLHFDTVAAMLKAIRSRIAFPKLLEQAGGVCPMKHSDKQGKDIPAISKADLDFVRMADDPNPNVALLVKTRLEQNSSIQLSRAVSLEALSDKPVPIILAAYKAHTGRYTAGGEGASDGLNFQNLSKRDPNQLAIRRALKVAPGMAVVACDSSQVEARMLAWVAEQNDLVEQFATGRDPYAELAAKIFGRSAQEIHNGAKDRANPEHDFLKRSRNVGKTATLSAGYGVSAQRFSDTLLRQGIQLDPDLSKHLQIATQAHSTYRTVNSNIVRFWKTCDQMARIMAGRTDAGAYFTFGRGQMLVCGRELLPFTKTPTAYIKFPNGYRLWYPNLRFGADNCVYDRLFNGRLTETKLYGGACCENIIQGLAFAMLAWQAVQMHKRGVLLKANIHDAFIAVVPETKAEQTKALMIECMSAVPDWLKGFPVGCEAELGKDFTIA